MFFALALTSCTTTFTFCVGLQGAGFSCISFLQTKLSAALWRAGVADPVLGAGGSHTLHLFQATGLVLKAPSIIEVAIRLAEGLPFRGHLTAKAISTLVCSTGICSNREMLAVRLQLSCLCHYPLCKLGSIVQVV